MTPHWTAALGRINACAEAVTWAKAYPSLAEAWDACERADWMLWLLDRTCGVQGRTTHRALPAAAAMHDLATLVRTRHQAPPTLPEAP